MPTSTTNYSLQKPLVNNATDQDLWGGELNDDLDSIDTLMRQAITITSEATQTSGFTATASISVKKLYPCDATIAGFTATIPPAASSGNGATVFIKKTDTTAHVITLARSGSDTLDGDTTVPLNSENDCLGFVSDGVSRWNSICEIASTVAPDASTSVKGIIQLATSAEVRTATDSLKAVVPSSVSSHPGVAKGRVVLNGTGSSPITPLESYGNATGNVTKLATGRYSVDLSPNFTTAYYSACPVAAQVSGNPSTVSIEAQTASTFTFNVQDDVSGLVDSALISITFFGNTV